MPRIKTNSEDILESLPADIRLLVQKLADSRQLTVVETVIRAIHLMDDMDVIHAAGWQFLVEKEGDVRGLRGMY